MRAVSRLNERQYPRTLRFPNNGIREYEKKSLDDQGECFSALIQRKGGSAIRKIWPKLHLEARFYIMTRLGCLSGPSAPQVQERLRFERGWAVGKEIEQAIKDLKKYQKVLGKTSQRLTDLRFTALHVYMLVSDLDTVLLNLEDIKAKSSMYFARPHDWEVRNIIQAQEFVKQTSTTDSRVTLSAGAIADIFDLNECGSVTPVSVATEERVQKAVRRFRRKVKNKNSLDETGGSIRDPWILKQPEEMDSQPPKI